MESQLLFELVALVVFAVFMFVYLYIKRKKVALQKILFPFFYLIMLRTGFGLKWMDHLSTKYREWVKLFGYCSIGIGFIGMIYISLSIVLFIVQLVFQPEISQPGVSLVLPFTHVPGIGYLSFTHWIIAIFILAIVHEFAHGVVARAHNVKIKSTGFAVFAVFLPLIPAAFVEPDEKQLQKESDIVQYSVFAAGPVINILLAFLIVLAFPFAADLTNSKLAPFEDTLSYSAGFSYEVLKNESYPAYQTGLPDSVITTVNGHSVSDYSDFYKLMIPIEAGDDVLLGTDDGDFSITTVASPTDSEKGFLGVKPLKNERRVFDEYATVAPYYYWVRGLIKWLFLLNFFIGLANLLPLGIVDGGRMLEVALHKVYTNKKKAKKMWGFIGIIFISSLVFALLVNYFGNPFSLFW